VGAIAGQEVGQPRSIGEVDAAWMQSVLRTSGAIDEGTEVVSITAEPFAVGAGLLSLLHRVVPAYAGGDGPASVIVKFPIDHPVQRHIADSLGFYPREIRFYRELAASTKVRVPQVHAAMIAADSTDFVVVMEELHGKETADQRDGATWPQVLASLDAMAAFHASWHESPHLDELTSTFPPMLNPGYLHGLPPVFQAGWPHALEHAGDLLTPELVAFGERYCDLLEYMLTTANTPRTFVHGDWRLDNLFFDDDGVTVIDYQISGIASGVYDLAYFVSQSIAPEVRRGREDELIDRYLAGLAAHGVVRDRDEVVHQFKVGVAQCFIYGVSSFPSYAELPERSQQLMRLLLGRSGQAIIDIDALSAFPA
jgi:aminoglycoside phosphotransferase (APT) family kinase protein